MVKYSHKAKRYFTLCGKDEVHFLMKRQTDLKLLLLLLLTCCMIVFCSCGADVKDGVGTEAPNENVGDFIDNEPEKTDGVEFTTVNTNAKILRTVKIYSETKNFTNATETVKKELLAAGGYIQSSEITGGESLYNGSKTPKKAIYVLRVPADKLDNYVDLLKNMLNVTSYTETTKDVTLEYYDLQSRIKTLEMKKSSLEALLENAKSVDEIKTYQDELFSVITEIESLKSKLNVYDNKVNYSTVGLQITEVLEYTETNNANQSFGNRLSDTFESSWEGLGTFFEYFAIFIVAIFPALLIIGAITSAVLTIIHFVRRKKRNKNDQNK